MWRHSRDSVRDRFRSQAFGARVGGEKRLKITEADLQSYARATRDPYERFKVCGAVLTAFHPRNDGLFHSDQLAKLRLIQTQLLA